MRNWTENAEALDQDMSPDLIGWREENWSSGPVPYIRSHDAINHANKFFGHDGWCYTIDTLTDICKEPVKNVDKNGNEKTGWLVGVCATVRVEVATQGNPVIREDVGYGTGIDYSSMALPKAFESAGKEAVSDALKRALRSFGNQFGNQLYDKDFINTLEKPGRSTKPTSASGNEGNTTRPDGKIMTGMITENQVKFIYRLLKDKKVKIEEVAPGKTVEELTKQEASAIIDNLNKEVNKEG
jgi:DNA recombination protein Rad52